MRSLVVVALLLTGCSRCAPKGPVDAGTVKTFSTDLRTVVLTMFPEYRGTAVKSGVVRLTRTYAEGAEWQTRVRALFAKNRVVEQPSDAGLSGTFDLFSFRVSKPSAGQVEAIVELPIDQDTLGRLYSNPASLSTPQLGLYLPRDVTIERDVFDFELVYEAVTDRRAAFLTRQVVELMLSNQQWTSGPLPEGWQPNLADGGYGDVPARFSVTLTGVVDGAHVTVSRDELLVTVHYQLVTLRRE